MTKTSRNSSRKNTFGFGLPNRQLCDSPIPDVGHSGIQTAHEAFFVLLQQERVSTKKTYLGSAARLQAIKDPVWESLASTKLWADGFRRRRLLLSSFQVAWQACLSFAGDPKKENMFFRQ